MKQVFAFLIIIAFFAYSNTSTLFDVEDTYVDLDGNFDADGDIESVDRRGVCFTDSGCARNEYCRGLICYGKNLDGGFCKWDSICLSGHCHHGKCKGQQQGKDVSPNGPCNRDEDCRFEQYCKSGKCSDRKTSGSCTSDSHCMSNHCSWFKCKPVRN